MVSVKKNRELLPQKLRVILDDCANGVTLADPHQEDCPLIYVNKAFESLTGYGRAEIVGRNCRFLQTEDRDERVRSQIAEAIRNRTEVTALLRNYKKDGTLFYNRLTIQPLFDTQGNVLLFLGLQYDATDRECAGKAFQRFTYSV